MKKLEIIIPHYNEKENIIYKNLLMLSLQENVNFNDFEVTIVNDGPNAYEFKKEYLDLFKPLHIRQITNPTNGGPGMSRQYGIDNSKSKWIMFIDADDCLLTLDAIHQFLAYIKKYPDTDIFRSEFKYTQDNLIIRQSLSAITWLHGKVYRREFLDKYNIRFFEDIRCSEDVAFNLITRIKGKKQGLIPMDLYLYRNINNSQSITTITKGDKINVSHIKAVRESLKYIKEHIDIYESPEKIFYNNLNYCWYLLNMFSWTDKELKEEYENELVLYFIENSDLYNSITAEDLNKLYYLQTKDFVENTTTDNPGINFLRNSSYETQKDYFLEKIKELMK